MIYFRYDEYFSVFGNTHRPALVRHHEQSIKYKEAPNITVLDTVYIATLYIDGKSIENTSPYEFEPDLVIVQPLSKSDKDGNNMTARPFNPNSVDDWYSLFYDISEFHRLGDKLAYALIAIALDGYDLHIPIICDAINTLHEPAKSQILDLIEYASYGLSPFKIHQINELNRAFNRSDGVFFPAILEDAATQYDIQYDTLNVHSLADKIFDRAEKVEVENPIGFSRFVQWLKDDTLSISLQELDACFAYLGTEQRSLAIKRFFFDVKRGILKYDPSSLSVFSSQNYLYYSTLRYIFEAYPEKRNVSTEFFLSCLNIYEKTNQQSFQVSDGILDWAIQKQIEVNRPIETDFNDWLCYCEGGILINRSFRGFATFEIKYELDDFAFEEESVKRSIHSIVERNCRRLFHEEEIVQTDPVSGEPIITKRRVFENRWKLHNKGDKRLINLFVNWEKRPDTEQDKDIFTPEMVDYSIVRDNVEQYLNATYGTISPYVSERRPDDILKMFAYEIRMRVRFDEDIILGENPGVKEEIVKQRIREQMAELFGETFECEYDPAKYHRALADSLFRLTGDSEKCFEKREKMYSWERKIYCAPELTDSPNLLTGKKCANCQGDMCFITGIKKNPDWQEYTIIHILEIIGYHILEETEAGLIPNHTYIQFVTLINKAIRFTKRLVCKECGHVLFPARDKGHSRFKCLMLSCSQFNKEIYLNVCYNCKKGIIDSRDTKQCPNGLYICPLCNSCCSNTYFEYMAERYRILGKRIPLFISRNIGNGHKDRDMVFCPKCGSQMTRNENSSGESEFQCLNCNPQDNSNMQSYDISTDLNF